VLGRGMFYCKVLFIDKLAYGKYSSLFWVLDDFISLPFYQPSPNGMAHFENHKQLLEYQNFLLRRDIWWSKF